MPCCGNTALAFFLAVFVVRVRADLLLLAATIAEVTHLRRDTFSAPTVCRPRFRLQSSRKRSKIQWMSDDGEASSPSTADVKTEEAVKIEYARKIGS